MTKSILPALATVLCLDGLAASAEAAGPQVWGSPNGQQSMLQCLQQGGDISTSASGLVTCCIDDRCIACDGPETCQVTIVGIPGDIATPPMPSTGPTRASSSLPQLQIRN